ncbi:Protein of unknown function [Gryllus bimaculatus]|nr:Protein of unknown function [Gryllus bimaculatus]
MDARGTGQALFDAAAALSESRGTQHQPANALLRHSSQCPHQTVRREQGRGTESTATVWSNAATPIAGPPLSTCFLVVFFVLIVLICICKYCIKALYESGWAMRRFGERRGLLLHAQRTDLPPPYYTRSPERWGKRSCSTSETEFSSLGPDVEQPLASLPAP